MNDITIFTYENTNVRTITTEDGTPPLLWQGHSLHPRIRKTHQSNPGSLQGGPVLGTPCDSRRNPAGSLHHRRRPLPADLQLQAP